jgi:hypothetical protein
MVKHDVTDRNTEACVHFQRLIDAKGGNLST